MGRPMDYCECGKPKCVGAALCKNCRNKAVATASAINPKRVCECGKSKHARAIMCSVCRRAKTKEAYRNNPKRICKCGRPKADAAIMCKLCRHVKRSAHKTWDGLTVCSCGRPKSYRSPTCKVCYWQDKSRFTSDGFVLCDNCGPLLSTEFYFSAKMNKPRAICKECCKTAGRISNIRRKCKKYGVPPELAEQILDRGFFQCQICDKKIEKFHIDHCHDTGEFRGILCPNCNSGIGLLGDDPDVCERAAQYLRASIT